MRRKKYILLILTMLLFNPQSFGYTFTTYEPPEVIRESGTTYPKISRIESIVFNKTYETDDIEARLQRLERKTCSRIYAGSDLAWRVDNIMSRIDQSSIYNIPSNELAAIERKILGRSFKKEPLNSRLSRLETNLLGATQSGKPDERFQTLLTAANNYSSFQHNSIMPNTIGFTQGSGVKGTLQNIFSSLLNSGCMTGYTPPISPYGYNAPYGFNPTLGTYGPIIPNYTSQYGYNGYNRSLRTNTGYYNTNKTTGSGCGIHILD